VCIDFDFEASKVDEYIESLKTNEKYKGIAAYEW
jgi:hypothetical protein